MSKKKAKKRLAEIIAPIAPPPPSSKPRFTTNEEQMGEETSMLDGLKQSSSNSPIMSQRFKLFIILVIRKTFQLLP
jgi:hypothetical protein